MSPSATQCSDPRRTEPLSSRSWSTTHPFPPRWTSPAPQHSRSLLRPPRERLTCWASGTAGRVGTATVQLARERGAKVIGTAREVNHDYLRSIGAVPTTYGEGLVE